MDARRIICIITVYQNINRRIDVEKHSAHDVTFALLHFAANDGAVLSRDFYGIVRGVVVVNGDNGLGQLLEK